MFEGKLGFPELLFLLVIALLVFGPSRIGQVGKGLGEAIRNFRSAMKEEPAKDPQKPA